VRVDGHRADGASDGYVLAAMGRGPNRDEQQDRCAAVYLPDGRWLLALADGVGGYDGGAQAAQAAVDGVLSAVGVDGFRSHPTVADLGRPAAWSPDAVQRRRSDVDLVSTAVAHAQARVLALSRTRPLEKHTTIVVAVANREHRKVTVAHVGDSRAYLWEPFGQGALRTLTEDHTRGPLLAQALGQREVHPSISEYLAGEGSVLLLCTDGLTNALRAHDSPKPLAQEFRLATRRASLAARLAQAVERGGFPDNCTFLLARL
jgi:protein phosphatase